MYSYDECVFNNLFIATDALIGTILVYLTEKISDTMFFWVKNCVVSGEIALS